MLKKKFINGIALILLVGYMGGVSCGKTEKKISKLTTTLNVYHLSLGDHGFAFVLALGIPSSVMPT